MNPIRGVIRKLKALGWYPFYNGFYEHLRTDKKIILLESRGGNALEGNILRIAMELSDRRYKEYRVIIAVKNSARQTVKEKRILWFEADAFYKTGFHTILLLSGESRLSDQ